MTAIRSGELRVTEEEIENADQQVSEELKHAIELAKKNIEAFHAAQKTEKVSVETIDRCELLAGKKTYSKDGLYIPGGTAPLFSTILMLASSCKNCRM